MITPAVVLQFATQFLPINYYITIMSTVSTVSTMSTRVARYCYQASTNQLLNHYDVYNIYSLYSLYKDFQGLLMKGPKIQPIGSLLPVLHCMQLVTGTPAPSGPGRFMAKFTILDLTLLALGTSFPHSEQP